MSSEASPSKSACVEEQPARESATPTTRVKLLDGGELPIFGLGVYKSSPGRETEDAVLWALQAGYRMIDTAALYGNEASVGAALRRSGVPRKDIFITTKLWKSDHGYNEAMAACRASIKALGVRYVDMYLVHTPGGGKLVETWDALLELQRQGLVLSVGVSNCNVDHIETLAKHGRPLPAVNQIEMHPMIFREREALVRYCQEKGIVVQAYGSIFAGKTQFLEDPGLNKVAAECGKSVGQTLLRWGHQMGFVIIPKSVKQRRILENMEIFDFELAPDQMEVLTSMRGRLGAYWNPLGERVDVGDISKGGAQMS